MQNVITEISQVVSEYQTKTINKKGLLTVEQYANKKDISEWNVRKLCRLGKVECYRYGNKWLIPKNARYDRFGKKV